MQVVVIVPEQIKHLFTLEELIYFITWFMRVLRIVFQAK